MTKKENMKTYAQIQNKWKAKSITQISKKIKTWKSGKPGSFYMSFDHAIGQIGISDTLTFEDLRDAAGYFRFIHVPYLLSMHQKAGNLQTVEEYLEKGELDKKEKAKVTSLLSVLDKCLTSKKATSKDALAVKKKINSTLAYFGGEIYEVKAWGSLKEVIESNSSKEDLEVLLEGDDCEGCSDCSKGKKSEEWTIKFKDIVKGKAFSPKNKAHMAMAKKFFQAAAIY